MNRGSAATPVPLSSVQEHFSLSPYVDLLEDPTRAWDLDRIRKAQAYFKPSTQSVPAWGFSQSAQWARFKLAVPFQGDKEYHLEFEYPLIEHRIDWKCPS